MRILLLLLLLPFSASAQRFNWSTSAGYPAVANSYLGTVDLATDAEGNAYVMDYANINQVCQGDTVERLRNNYNLFLYKFNPNGDLVWGKTFAVGVGGSWLLPLNLEFGPDNTLYMLAQLNGDTLVTENNSYPINGPTNVIVSINTDGISNWAHDVEFNCSACLMLEIANNRIYYQAGQTLIKSMEFDQTPDTNYSYYYDPATAIFTLPIQGSAVFNNGDILLAGLHRGDASFIEGDTLLFEGNAGLYNNIAYVRLSPDLQPIWSKSFPYLHDPETHFIPVDIDENNQIYTGWEVQDSITIAGTTVLGDFNLWAGTLLSMDENGNPLWLRELSSSSSLQILDIMADDESNQVWFCGLTSSSTTIGDSTIVPSAIGSPFLASMNAAGEFSKQATLNELPGGSKGRTLGKAGSGHYYLGGNLNNGSNYTINCIEYPGSKGLFVSSFFDVPQNPPTPGISANGNILTASPSFEGTIQWLLNGVAIPGANSSSYEAQENGQYSVVYSYDYGCESIDSSSVIFVETGIKKLYRDLTVYPNPAQTSLQWNVPIQGEMAVRIYSATGQLLQQFRTQNQGISTLELPNGIYLFQLETNDAQWRQHFIVAH